MPMKVWMKFKKHIFDGVEQTLDNVTEIHFNFKNSFRKNRIVFESDIERLGCVYDISEIEEFEAIDGLLGKQEDMLTVRNEIIDAIDDIKDYLEDDDDISCMKRGTMERLENALNIMNKVLDEFGINEDYEPE